MAEYKVLGSIPRTSKGKMKYFYLHGMHRSRFTATPGTYIYTEPSSASPKELFLLLKLIVETTRDFILELFFKCNMSTLYVYLFGELIAIGKSYVQRFIWKEMTLGFWYL